MFEDSTFFELLSVNSPVYLSRNQNINNFIIRTKGAEAANALGSWRINDLCRVSLMCYWKVLGRLLAASTSAL
jgi:hypothetical protein